MSISSTTNPNFELKYRHFLTSTFHLCLELQKIFCVMYISFVADSLQLVEVSKAEVWKWIKFYDQLLRHFLHVPGTVSIGIFSVFAIKTKLHYLRGSSRCVYFDMWVRDMSRDPWKIDFVEQLSREQKECLSGWHLKFLFCRMCKSWKTLRNSWWKFSSFKLFLEGETLSSQVFFSYPTSMRPRNEEIMGLDEKFVFASLP